MIRTRIIFRIFLFIPLTLLLLVSCTKAPVAPAAPVARFSSELNQVETGQSLQFNDQSIGDISEWSWDFGDNTTSSEQNPRHAYSKPGNRTITLTIANKAGISTMNALVSVLEPPKAVFNSDQTLVGIDQKVLFLEKSSGDIRSFAWDFGDGETSSERNVSHSFSKKGNYLVSLKVSNELNSDNASQEITIVGPPVANFAVDRDQALVRSPFRFTDNSTGENVTYHWDFGDGTTDSAWNPTHIYSGKGRYMVSLTVSNVAGSDTKRLYVTTMEKTVSGFSVSKTKAMIGETIDFKDESTGDIDSWFWDFGDNTTSIQWSPKHFYKSGGVYTVSLKVSNDVSSNVTIKKDLIRISTLTVHTNFANQINATTLDYTPKTDEIFLPGESVYVVFDVSGFDQPERPGGYEVWIRIRELKVGSPQGSVDLNNVAEAHKTIPKRADTVRLWIYAGKYYPTGNMYIGSISVTIEDVLSGVVSTNSHAFLVMKPGATLGS